MQSSVSHTTQGTHRNTRMSIIAARNMKKTSRGQFHRTAEPLHCSWAPLRHVHPRALIGTHKHSFLGYRWLGSCPVFTRDIQRPRVATFTSTCSVQAVQHTQLPRERRQDIAREFADSTRKVSLCCVAGSASTAPGNVSLTEVGNTHAVFCSAVHADRHVVNACRPCRRLQSSCRRRA